MLLAAAGTAESVWSSENFRTWLRLIVTRSTRAQSSCYQRDRRIAGVEEWRLLTTRRICDACAC